MVRTRMSRPVRTAALGVVAGAVALAAALVAVPAEADLPPGVTIAPTPVTAVPLAQAGEVVMWGSDNLEGQLDVPASLSGVAISQVVLGSSVALALTAAGQVVGWGGDTARTQRIPGVVSSAEVAQIAIGPTGNGFAGAVTRDGRVLVWGVTTKLPSPLEVPAGLTGVKQLAFTGAWNAVALKNDGSVVAWGDPATGITDVPAGLRATAIVAGTKAVFALTESGTVVAWGAPDASEATTLPAGVQVPGNVKAIAGYGNGAVALLADETLIGWGIGFGGGSTTDFPGSVLAATPGSITGAGLNLAMVDGDGAIHHWLASDDESYAVPSQLTGRPIAHLAIAPQHHNGAAVVTKMLRAALPTIVGSPSVGGTLTATPGTFSASPAAVTNQWLADGVPIAGATGPTLAVTSALAGKKVTYQSTATKPGETTISSTSDAVTVAAPVVVTPAPAKVGSSTKVLKVVVAKKAASVKVTGKVTATKPPTGKATVTIKKGKKAIVSKTVVVSAKGAVALTVKKFAQLVAKKLKAKGKKARIAYRGAYTVIVAYAGNAQVKPSAGTKRIAIKK